MFYDADAGSWSVSSLSEAKGLLAAMAIIIKYTGPGDVQILVFIPVN
jgi:hypothetical protein